MEKRRRVTEAVSEKAIRLYGWMMRFYADCGYMPTVREMCSGMGISSTSLAQDYLGVLAGWGWVERGDRASARNIRLTRVTERGLRPEQIAALMNPSPIPSPQTGWGTSVGNCDEA